MKKRLFSLFLALFCMLSFTGCSTNAISLLRALQKDADITSVKTNEVVSGSMKITLPEEIKEDMDVNLQSILNMLSSFRLEATTLQQIKGNSAAVKSSFSIFSEDTSFDSEIYVSTNGGNAKTVLKIPTVAKALLPEHYENAAYFTIDTADMAKLTEKQNELAKLQAEYFGYDYTPVELPVANQTIAFEEVLKLNETIFDSFREYAAQMTDAPSIVTKKGNVYSVVLTDESFKELLSSLVLTYFDKPEARDAVKKLWDGVANYAFSLYGETTDNFFFPVLPELPQDPILATNARTQAELMLQLFKSARILGEDGIQITYTVNSKGFITELDTAIHLDFDINAITELLTGSADYEEDFAFEIRLNYNQKRQNINGVQQIPLPSLTKENNLPFYQLLSETMQEEIDRLKDKIENGDDSWNEPYEPDFTLPAPDGSTSIVVNYGDWQELMSFEDQKIINQNGTLYVPMEALMDYQGIEHDKNEENGYRLFRHPYTYQWMWFYPGSNVICSDEAEITMSAPTIVKDGQTYLPLRAFVSAFTDYRIRWSQEENAVYLTPWYYFE